MEAWPPGGKQRPLNPLTVPAAHKKQRFSHEGFALAPNVPFPHSWLTRAALSGRRRGGGWRGVGGLGWETTTEKMEKLAGTSELHPKATPGRSEPRHRRERLRAADRISAALALKSPLTNRPDWSGFVSKGPHCQKVLGAAIKKK